MPVAKRDLVRPPHDPVVDPAKFPQKLGEWTRSSRAAELDVAEVVLSLRECGFLVYIRHARSDRFQFLARAAQRGAGLPGVTAHYNRPYTTGIHRNGSKDDKKDEWKNKDCMMKRGDMFMRD